MRAAVVVCLGMLSSAHSLASPPQPPIRSVVTFGDSWSDAGTFGTIYGTTPGSSWSQLLARRYGDDQTPYMFVSAGKAQILGGLNYAQGGAKTATPAKEGDPEDSLPNSAAAQIEHHKKVFGRFRPRQLIVLWIGTNDILAPFTKGDGRSEKDAQIMNSAESVPQSMSEAATATIHQAVVDQVKLIGVLLTNGAARLVVMNCPDMGWATFQPGTTRAGLERASELTALFNDLLAKAIPRDPRVLLVDANSILRRAANPASGFTHVPTDACANDSVVCGPTEYRERGADESYMFAGYGHLTRHARQLLASSVGELIDKQWSPGSAN